VALVKVQKMHNSVYGFKFHTKIFQYIFSYLDLRTGLWLGLVLAIFFRKISPGNRHIFKSRHRNSFGIIHTGCCTVV